MLLDFFDIQKYLDAKGIEYQFDGKNISNDWIGLSCPFCPDGDPSNHLGINLTSKAVNCWRCGTKGTIIKLIMKTERIPYENVSNVIKQFSSRQLSFPEENAHTERIKPYKIDFEKTISNQLLPLHKTYLEKRNFDAKYIFNKYKLKCGDILGEWAFRLIIPFYQYKTILTFIGRDITDKQDLKYKNYPNEKSLKEVKHTIYNLNNCKSDTIILVEGALDTWRIGDNCGAICGKQITMEQIKIIVKYKRVFILFDSDATKSGNKLANTLYPFINDVETLELTEGDPCDLTKQDVYSLRKEIFGRMF